MIVQRSLKEHEATLQAFLAQADLLQELGELWQETLQKGHKILFCGNGGSASDAQHLAAELVGRFQKNRKAIPGIALTTDTSILTAVANDFGYETIFARQVEALGAPGDLLVAISTSGNSANVVAAARVAKAKGLRIVGMTGESANQLDELADKVLHVPSHTTARIQEMHILAGHIWCEMVESGVLT